MSESVLTPNVWGTGQSEFTSGVAVWHVGLADRFPDRGWCALDPLLSSLTLL